MIHDYSEIVYSKESLRCMNKQNKFFFLCWRNGPTLSLSFLFFFVYHSKNVSFLFFRISFWTLFVNIRSDNAENRSVGFFSIAPLCTGSHISYGRMPFGRTDARLWHETGKDFKLYFTQILLLVWNECFRWSWHFMSLSNCNASSIFSIHAT